LLSPAPQPLQFMQAGRRKKIRENINSINGFSDAHGVGVQSEIVFGLSTLNLPGQQVATYPTRHSISLRSEPLRDGLGIDAGF